MLLQYLLLTYSRSNEHHMLYSLENWEIYYQSFIGNLHRRDRKKVINYLVR